MLEFVFRQPKLKEMPGFRWFLAVSPVRSTFISFCIICDGFAGANCIRLDANENRSIGNLIELSWVHPSVLGRSERDFCSRSNRFGMESNKSLDGNMHRRIDGHIVSCGGVEWHNRAECHSSNKPKPNRLRMNSVNDSSRRRVNAEQRKQKQFHWNMSSSVRQCCCCERSNTSERFEWIREFFSLHGTEHKLKS